jgi:hypothetical protein
MIVNQQLTAFFKGKKSTKVNAN